MYHIYAINTNEVFVEFAQAGTKIGGFNGQATVDFAYERFNEKPKAAWIKKQLDQDRTLMQTVIDFPDTSKGTIQYAKEQHILMLKACGYSVNSLDT
jgi:phosphoenolpyruvate carboxylase